MPNTNQLAEWNEHRMAEIKRAETNIANLQQWNTDRVTNENILSGRADVLEDWNQDRVTENQNQQGQIDSLLDWNQDRMTENQGQQTQINDLLEWNEDRIEEIKGNRTELDELSRHIRGQDSLLEGLSGNIKNIFNEGQAGHAAIQALWEEGGAGTQQLDELQRSLTTDWNKQTFGETGKELSLDEISKLASGALTTDDLKTEMTGLFEDGGAGQAAISDLFATDDEGNYTGDIGAALDKLNTDLVDTYNLDDLSDASTDIATNLESIQGLDKRITGWETTAATNQADVAKALTKVGGLETDLTTATTNIENLRTDAKSWVDDLSTTAATERSRIEGLLGTASEAWNQRLTDLSASMDYRTLGDSAEGVRTRKSQARKLGKTNFGTGQLNRSMRTLSGLNL